MSNLSGKKLKDVYKSFITTENDSGIGVSLQRMQDGAGNDLPISISSSEVRIDKLKLNEIGQSTSSDVVTVGSDGVLGKRKLPVFKSPVVTLSGTNDPTISISDGVGNTTSIQFAGGNGMNITRSGNTFNFAYDSSVNIIDAPVTLTVNDIKYLHVIDGDGLDGGVITLPAPQKGLIFRFKISVSDSKAFFFTCNDRSTSNLQYIYGSAKVLSTTNDKNATQVVKKSVAAATPASYSRLTLSSTASTSGGVEGDCFELVAIDSESWLLTAILNTTSSTPSSIAVIN